jgi:hypothetical protein
MQKTVSMSYPEQMMDYDSSPKGYMVGSLQTDSHAMGKIFFTRFELGIYFYLIGSSHGSSFGNSPYGFAPGSAPNTFMMQHSQQQLKVTCYQK